MTACGSDKGDDGWREDTFDWDFREYASQPPHHG